MSTVAKWISRDASSGWAELIFRALEVALIAFIVLQLKELFEAGAFDTAATAFDAALIAIGVFVLNAFLKLMKF